jgi:hypothetical protein
MELVKKGLDTKEIKFACTCKLCDCEFKYCLDAVKVTRYGQTQREIYVHCPGCRQQCPVDVGKYTPLLIQREVYTPESDY